MQDIQFKANSGQFNIDEAQGIVECFVAGIGNKDSVGDICAVGAFAKSLQRRKPRVVWGHNWNDPIGKVLEIYEVSPNDARLPMKMKIAGIGGLYAKVQFNLNSEKGREAFTNVAFFGEEQEWSIGYKTLDAIFDNSKQANVLREVELYELSPVLHGANQLTGTISVKTEKTHEQSPIGMIVLDKEPYDEEPNDPFAAGLAQPLTGDRLIAITNELSTRTGGPIKVMKATESSIVFLKPGKGMFRLGYYFTGEEYMFGKPEKLSTPMMTQQPMPGMMRPGGEMRPQQRIPNFPNVQGKPQTPNMPLVPIKYGESDNQSGLFDSSKSEESLDLLLEEKLLTIKQQDIAQQLLDITSSLQNIIEVKTEENVWMIPCELATVFETKQALDPVFDFHRIETVVTENGIVLTSPLTDDAFEAIGVATKNLIGRIGRGLVPGGGGKVGRGRTALSKLTGELDPKKRRDIDGDGFIFDGTWRQMPAPPKVPTTPRQGLSSESSEPKDDVVKPKIRKMPGGSFWYQQWALQNPPRRVVPFIFPRTAKPKLVRMFDDFLNNTDSTPPEIIARIAEAIKTAQRYSELSMPGDPSAGGQIRGKQTQDFLPQIDEEMLKELQKVWPEIKEKFKEVGGHRRKENGVLEKGRTSYEILETLVEKGSYERVNKAKTQGVKVPSDAGGRQQVLSRVGETTNKPDNEIVGGRRIKGGIDRAAGKPSAAVGQKRRETPYPKNIEDAPFVLRRVNPDSRNNFDLKIEFEKKGKNLLKPYIDAEIFPKDFQEMSVEKQFAWFKDNRNTLVKNNDSLQWKTLIKKFEDFLFQETFKLEEAEEREQNKTPKIVTPTVQATPKSPSSTPAISANDAKPIKPKVGTKKFDSELGRNINAWYEVIVEAVKRDNVGDDFKEEVLDLADRVVARAIPEAEKPTPETAREAIEEFDEGIIQLAKLRAPRSPKKLENNQDGDSLPKISKNEDGINAFMFQVRAFLEDFAGREDDTQEDLGRQDIVDALSSRGNRISEVVDLEDDDIDEMYGDDNNFGRFSSRDDDDRGFSSSTMQNSIMSARRFQASNKRKKEGGSRGLSSLSAKEPRTEITDESTWWKQVDGSLSREISKADSESTKKGLLILQQKIKKYDAAAFTPNSKRTNAGSIKISADEADQILDAVMAVVDRQKTAGKNGNVGTRGEIFAELLEKIASAAMSTFVDKTTRPTDNT